MNALSSPGPGTSNRIWLGLLGLILLLAGIAGVLIGTGVANSILGTLGAPFAVPGSGDSVAAPQPNSPIAVAIFTGVGVVFTLFGVLWLAAQVPGREPTRSFRMSTDIERGTTQISPSALSEAVTADIAALHGVVNAQVRLRGTLLNPDMLVDLVVNDDADVQAILSSIEGEVAGDLLTTIEGTIASIRVHIEATQAVRSDKDAMLPAGTAGPDGESASVTASSA